MINREKVIKGLTHHKLCMCDMSGKICPYWNEDDGCSKKMLEDAIALLKEQESLIKALKSDLDETLAVLGKQPEIVRCEDCKHWIPGYITEQDDFIPPKCGKYQQMVGHSADDYCSLAEKQEGR